MRVAIFGGTGFVGSYLVDALLADGHTPSLLVREGSESKIRHASACEIVTGDVSDEKAVHSTLEDCDAAIFNVGILREDPKQGVTFEALQLEAAKRVIKAAKKAGVERFLLMSANGVRENGTDYQRTKYLAEQAVRDSGLDYTIFRPSVIFGDPRGRMEIATQLLNDVVRPLMPAPGFLSGLRPKTDAVMLSPIHVRDVADAFVAALTSEDSIEETYELGGPEAVSWSEIIRRIGRAVGKKKLVLPAPIPLVKLPVSLLDWIPDFPVTRDQLTMLAEGNTPSASDFTALVGREPRPFNEEFLSYLRRDSERT